MKKQSIRLVLSFMLGFMCMISPMEIKASTFCCDDLTPEECCAERGKVFCDEDGARVCRTRCQTCDEREGVCSAETPYCVNRECQKCAKGNVLSSQTGACQDCYSSTNAISLLTEECSKCPNRFFYPSNNTCILCSTTASNLSTNRSDCLKCGNRYMLGTNETGFCYFCDGEVSADGTACEWKCNAGMTGTASTCVSCDVATETINFSNYETCLNCANRFYHSGNKTCILCSTKATNLSVNRDDCLRCGNRYMLGTAEKGMCYFCDGEVSADGTACQWNCGTGMTGTASTCVSCDVATEVLDFSNFETCSGCPNRFYDTSTQKCALCSTSGVNRSAYRSDCLKCGNRYMAGTGETGLCLPCAGVVWDNGTKCLVCSGGQIAVPNTGSGDEYVCCPSTSAVALNGVCCGAGEEIVDGLCTKCPSGSYSTTAGQCYECSSLTSVYGMTRAECHRCDKRFFYYVTAGGWAYCAHCDATSGYETTLDECLRCENRCLHTEGLCLLAPASLIDNEGECKDCSEGSYLIRSAPIQCSDCSLSPSTYPVKEVDCHSCANRFHYYTISGGWSYCAHCSNVNTYSTTLENCQRCPQRYWTSDVDTRGDCKICPAGQKASSDGLSCVTDD